MARRTTGVRHSCNGTGRSNRKLCLPTQPLSRLCLRLWKPIAALRSMRLFWLGACRCVLSIDRSIDLLWKEVFFSPRGLVAGAGAGVGVVETPLRCQKAAVQEVALLQWSLLAVRRAVGRGPRAQGVRLTVLPLPGVRRLTCLLSASFLRGFHLCPAPPPLLAAGPTYTPEFSTVEDPFDDGIK